MLGEFIEASINFTNADVFKMYGVIFVVLMAICVGMYRASLKDD